jgi:hypothetical protein
MSIRHSSTLYSAKILLVAALKGFQSAPRQNAVEPLQKWELQAGAKAFTGH